ncbi:MAG: GNAT family N-acetyltransferase [Desulfosarcinaceae bacterium]|jgi:putative acetyltransferase
MEIKVDDLSSPEVRSLLDEHLQHMIAVTPPGCVHALDIDALKSPEITFWSVWEGPSLLGCGALKQLDQYHAEIKSMRTATSHQGRGVASHLLQFILDEARKRNFPRVSLETGSYDAFIPARKLYEKFGFNYCDPFADYAQNKNSVFMTIEL